MTIDWRELAGLGFSIFPVYFRSKLPALASWEPFQTRLPTVEELAEWTGRNKSNVGVVTGAVSNVIALDCDSQEAFDAVTRLGVPPTPRVSTARGWHLYFRWPGYPVANAAGLLPGVDVRGDGGYVVGPGSVHPTGVIYEWATSPREVPFAPVPEWLLDMLAMRNGRQGVRLPYPTDPTPEARSNAYANAALSNETMAVALAPEGQRNAQLNKSAFNLGGLVKVGVLAEETVTRSLLRATEANGLLQEDGMIAATKTIASGLKASQPRVLPVDFSARPSRSVQVPSAFFDDEPPRPLSRPVTEPQPFPVDALGPLLATAASAIEAKVRAHPAICAASVLAAANLAVQGHADVVLPSGQSRPISLYFISIAESGDRKSSVDHEALRPIYAREAVLRDQYEASLPSYQNDKAAHDRARDTILKANAKADRAVIRQALDRLGPPPTPPLKPALLCSEPTFEGLYKLFLLGQPSLGLFSTEGGGFVGGHGMNDEARLRTATGLSRLWDGVAIDRIRAGDGDQILIGRRLSCHLMVQPKVANDLLADEAMADQGLLSRMLTVAPPTLAGTRFWEEVPASAGMALKAYHTRLEAILEHPLPLVPGRRNELSPRLLPMSDAARSLWIGFADEIEYHLGSGGQYAAIRSRANKGAEMAARVAATLALFDDIHAGHIDETGMQRGMTVVRHFLSEARRMSEQALADHPLRLAALVLDWLKAEWKPDAISLPDIYQRGPAQIRDQASARSAVTVLEAHGWLRRLPEGATIDGTRRREAWAVRREGC